MAVWRAKMKTPRMVDPGLVLARLRYAKGAATLVARDPADGLDRIRGWWGSTTIDRVCSESSSKSQTVSCSGSMRWGYSGSLLMFAARPHRRHAGRRCCIDEAYQRIRYRQ